jgi:hypothetical protein
MNVLLKLSKISRAFRMHLQAKMRDVSIAAIYIYIYIYTYRGILEKCKKLMGVLLPTAQTKRPQNSAQDWMGCPAAKMNGACNRPTL